MLRVFLLAVLAVSLVYTTVAAYQIVRSGIQLGFFWPLLLRTFAYPFAFSIPVALLFGTTLVVSRMTGDREVTAMQTHGVPHLHVFGPVVGLGFVLTLLSFHLNGWVVPELHYEKRNLQKYILKQLEDLGSGVNRTLMLPDGEGSLWVGSYEGTEMRRVRVDLYPNKQSNFLQAIREHLPNRLPSQVTIFASEGKIEIRPDKNSVVLHLRSVEVLVPQTVKGGTVNNEVFHQKFAVTDNIMIPLAFSHKSRGTKDRKTPSLLRRIGELEHQARELPREGDAAIEFSALTSTQEQREEKKALTLQKIAHASTEFHRRLAITLSCLTFPFVGVAVSLLLHRFSRLVPFFVGNLVVLGVFYPLLVVGIVLGELGIAPMLSLALPNLALLAVGIFATRKVVAA